MDTTDIGIYLEDWVDEQSSTEDWFRNLEGKLLYVTQMSAICAARAAGRGDKHLADMVAVNAMRKILGSIEGVETLVKIGEGVRDKAPMLYIGEIIGKGSHKIDLAVDPLENTNATAKLEPNAICVLAASTRGGLMTGIDGYMEKLVVGPELVGKVYIRSEVEKNVRAIAEGLNREPNDINITVLDRDRNRELIERIKNTGTRVREIPDGDLIPAVLTCLAGSSTHALMGIGAIPEGEISATAVKLLGGEMQALFWPKNEDEKRSLINLGIDVDRVYYQNDLAPGEDLVYCTTAVTSLVSATKTILDGVSFFGGAAITNSLLITNSGLEKISKVHVLNRREFEVQGSEFRLF